MPETSAPMRSMTCWRISGLKVRIVPSISTCLRDDVVAHAAVDGADRDDCRQLRDVEVAAHDRLQRTDDLR